jgi:hypothetical protein
MSLIHWLLSSEARAMRRFHRAAHRKANRMFEMFRFCEREGILSRSETARIIQRTAVWNVFGGRQRWEDLDVPGVSQHNS